MTKKKPDDDWMPKCATCAFFVEHSNDEIGDCRRLPPMIFPDGENSIGFSFSVTEPNLWCGEFKRRCDS